MRHTFTLLLTLIAALRAAPSTNFLEKLTLDQAILLAENQHPDLAEARALAEAAAGRAQQAGTFPNPALVGRIEAAPVQGDTLGQAEYLAGLEQSIPLSRRLSKARIVEELGRQQLTSQIEMKRLGLHQRVQSAFATALYQERAMRAQGDILAGADKAVALAKVRVEVGDAIPEVFARAELEATRTRIEFQRIQALREQALVALAGVMGMPNLSIRSLQGELNAAFEIPTLEVLASSLATNPAMAAAHADLAASEARVALAQAERVPDIKVEALYRRIEAIQQNTFDLGFSIPLPLFNRSQGKLRTARAELEAAEARSRSTALELDQNLRTAYVQLTTALNQSRALRKEILPRADTVLKAAEDRFKAGDTSLTDLLPVRRDWAAMQLSYLESLRDVMQAWAQVKSLTNR